MKKNKFSRTNNPKLLSPSAVNQLYSLQFRPRSSNLARDASDGSGDFKPRLALNEIVDLMSLK